ncbi:MAG: ShlB/FhaC/HecB family hemolysin secretion/activation protein [Zoogloea sp.]|uniref:ShlB/FhaC/HecB family hemolysin secretion/activation protein n=1 Tax=Zoogloea sp. TaxID=49181 RepID=UPI003F2FD382
MRPNCPAALRTPLWLLLVPLFAHATPPDAGRLLQDQERTALPDRPNLDALPKLDDAPPPALKADAGLRVTVSRFHFTRNSAFSEASLSPLVADLLGQTLSLAEINAAATRITQFYRDHGYFVARAYLPAQEIQNGVVEITVLEGRLGKLQLDNQSSIANRVVTPLLGDLTEGEAIAGAALERGLLLLNGLPGVEVQSTLKPGASVGTTDLDIQIKNRAPYSGNVTLDNEGNRYTGAWRVGGQVSLSNPLSLGDTLSLRAITSDDHFNYQRLAYQLPVGGSGLQVGAAYSAMDYQLGDSFTSLGAKGTAQITSVYALYPVVRSRFSNLNAQVNFDQKSLKDQQQTAGTQVSKKIDVVSLGVSGDRVDGALGGGFNTWSVTYSAGRLHLDAVNQADDALGHRTQGNYDKWAMSASRSQRLAVLGDRWSLLGQVNAQWAGKNLDSSEKLSLGGSQGVRAYPQGEAPVDDGWLANLEVRYRLNQDWQLAGFLDSAAGWLNHAPLASESNNYRTLSGMGLGASYAAPEGLNLNASLAWRTGNRPTSDNDRSPRVWLSLQKHF